MKKFSKNEELFILNETAAHKTQVEAFKAIAIVLGRTEASIRQKFFSLKEEYPNHPVYTIDWKRGNNIKQKKEGFIKRILKKLSHNEG